MRALRLHEWQSEATLCDVPEPVPGPGEVVIRIGGSGACHSDLHLMHDFVDGAVPWGPPFTLGHENAGWVDTVGIGGGTVPVGFFSLPYEVSVASTYWGNQAELVEVIELARTRAVQAHVQRFDLLDAAKAYAAMRDGTLSGRAVIVP